MVSTVTLLELVSAVSEYALSEEEVIGTVVHLVNSGRVRLGGIFRGSRFDLSSPGTSPAAMM